MQFKRISETFYEFYPFTIVRDESDNRIWSLYIHSRLVDTFKSYNDAKRQSEDMRENGGTA